MGVLDTDAGEGLGELQRGLALGFGGEQELGGFAAVGFGKHGLWFLWLDARMTPFFAYPPEVRRIIYTTNAIESLHMQLRKIVKNRGHEKFEIVSDGTWPNGCSSCLLRGGARVPSADEGGSHSSKR